MFPTNYQVDGKRLVPYCLRADVSPIPKSKKEHLHVQHLFKNELKLILLEAKATRPLLEVQVVLRAPAIISFDENSVYRLIADCFITDPTQALPGEQTKTQPDNPTRWYKNENTWQKR